MKRRALWCDGKNVLRFSRICMVCGGRGEGGKCKENGVSGSDGSISSIMLRGLRPAERTGSL